MTSYAQAQAIPWRARMEAWQRARESEPGCKCWCSSDCTLHPPDPCCCPPGNKSDACYDHGTVEGWWLAKEAAMTPAC